MQVSLFTAQNTQSNYGAVVRCFYVLIPHTRTPKEGPPPNIRGRRCKSNTILLRIHGKSTHFSFYSLSNDNLFLSKIQLNSRYCFEVFGLVGLCRGRGQRTTSVSRHDVFEHGARHILKLFAGTLPANCCFSTFV